MSNAAGNTGALLGKAAQKAGKPGPSPLDVWSHSVEGAKKQMAGYDPDGPPPVVQSMEALGKGVAGDWHSSSPSAVGKGLAQQGGAIKKQLVQLFHAEGSKPPEGVLGHVGLAFGLLTSVEQLVSMPLSMIPFPALPAVRILDMDVGLPHAHNHPPNLVPPAPPVPLPSTGPVIPIPILSGAGTVLINGMPAARCGDMGLGIWCGGYFPMFEIFLGSSSVWVEGARAARLAVDITKHCTFTTPKPSDPPMGPMFGFTITASGDVAIGGVPMPSLSAMAMAAGFKALFKGLGKAIGKLRGKLGKGAKAPARGPKVSNAPGTGAAPGSTRVRGKPSGKFHPCKTDRVDDLLGKLKGPGTTHKIPDGIYASELAALTKETGREFGVAVRRGELVLVEGSADSVHWGAQNLVMVHTHPTLPGHPPFGSSGIDNISTGDARVAAVQEMDGWGHPQAVIDDTGTVHHFDRKGVIDNPSMSPIGEGGLIDGMQHGPHGFVPRPTKYPRESVMQLKPDVTTCPACGRFVYACDDLYAVRNQWGLAEELPAVRTGLHHRACFEAAPFRAAYLALYEKNLRVTLQDRAADWPVLAIDELHALNLKPRLKEYTLYFFRHGQQVPFAGAEKLAAFREILARPELGFKPEAEAMALRDAGGWAVSFRERDVLDFALLAKDFAKILNHLGLTEAELVGRTLHLGELCARLEIQPFASSCPLERAKGEVREAETVSSGEQVSLTLAVERWRKILLTHGEFDRLQAFLGRIDLTADSGERGVSPR